jgi:hypothetical protein
MRAPARSSSIVVFGALVALAGACQKSGDALLYVTVTASPALSGVDTIDVTVTKVADAAPQTAGPLHYPCPDGGVEIGESGETGSKGETLTVIIPGSTGPVRLTVVARGPGGHELARGTSSPVDPHAGSITPVTVSLGSSGQPAGGTSDGAAEGGAEASGAGGSTAGSGVIGGGAGAAGGTNGTAGTTGAGGTAGSAGAAGGTNGTAGTTGAGGTAGGGATGTGGAGGTTCTAKGPRDCTSSKDNDCNGQPDDTETTFCQCSPNNSPRSCSTGLSGICMAGKQLCVVSSDKSTSAWGSCTQAQAKGTETCANPGADDDCDGAVDNVPSGICNVGSGLGACANNGHTGCNGTTQVCNPSTPAIGDSTSTAWHLNSAPNGSWDWNCDGVVTKQYPDQSPATPTCTGLSMSACSSVPQVSYALNPFACGDLGDIGSFYCVWLAAIPGCTNKSGQSTGYQQGCR